MYDNATLGCTVLDVTDPTADDWLRKITVVKALYKEWATFFNRDCTRERIEEGYDCLKNTYRIHPQDEHMIISFLKEEAALLDTLNKCAACIQRHFRASRKLSK